MNQPITVLNSRGIQSLYANCLGRIIPLLMLPMQCKYIVKSLKCYIEDATTVQSCRIAIFYLFYVLKDHLLFDIRQSSKTWWVWLFNCLSVFLELHVDFYTYLCTLQMFTDKRQMNWFLKCYFYTKIPVFLKTSVCCFRGPLIIFS